MIVGNWVGVGVGIGVEVGAILNEDLPVFKPKVVIGVLVAALSDMRVFDGPVGDGCKVNPSWGAFRFGTMDVATAYGSESSLNSDLEYVFTPTEKIENPGVKAANLSSTVSPTITVPRCVVFNSPHASLLYRYMATSSMSTD